MGGAAEHVSLEAWLDVAWFYPEGFERESIEKLGDGWLVRGNGFIYRFFEPLPDIHDDRSRFARNWQLACEELLDNAPWAPELHYSLRLLRWNDDEPQWFSFKPDGDLDPLGPPEGIDDVALVMRRLPEERSLLCAVRSRKGLPASTGAEAAETLAAFHRHQRDTLPPSERAWPLELIRTRHTDHLTKAFVSTGSFLDPFSRAAFLEIQGFIAGFLRANAELLPARFAEGWITVIHGALSLQTVLMPPHRSRGPVQLYGRADRGASNRYGDVLEDLAAISVELEAAGHRAAARELERSYSGELRAAASPALLRFYKASAALRKAIGVAAGSSSDTGYPYVHGSAAGDDPGRSVQLLSLGLRYALGLTRPFLIVIDGADTHCTSLAHALDALVSVTSLEADRQLPGHPVEAPRESRFDRLSVRIKRALSTGSSLLVRWPLNRDEERRALLQLAEAAHCPVLLVRYDDPEDATPRPHSSWPPPPQMPAISIYPLADLPHLALHVLHCLAGHKVNRERLGLR